MTRVAVIWAFIILLLGCSPAQDEPAALRIGVLPGQTAAQLREQYQPLVSYLRNNIGRPVELVVPEDYADLLSLFASGSVDAAFFGGLTFIQAQAQTGAIPLVIRDIDTRFTSLFFARRDADGSAVSDFAGKPFGFGSRLSTSGHLMPRYFLRSQGLVPEETFSSVIYTGAHDKTIMSVLDGSIDIGVANAIIIGQMTQSGRIDENDLKILWETPPYTNYVWALQPALEAELKVPLQDAFLSLTVIDEDQREILENLGTRSFLPVRQEDFEGLRAVALELGLL